MSNPNQERARMLLQQSRGKDAEDYARLAIQDHSDDPQSHYLLSVALLQQDRPDDALDPANEALRLAPEYPPYHYNLARIHFEQDRYADAKTSARRSLELDPEDPDTYGLLAFLAMNDAKWQDALNLAESGLRFESDHVACTNARANALTKLNRSDQAHASLDYALQRDPENPYTHYQKASALMATSDYERAAKHYCEALRLEPNFAEAKEGLVEALKGRHAMYAFFLKYVYFMERLSPGAQMGIILGGYFGHRILFNILAGADQIGAAYAVRALYIAIVYFTWTASSLFNLLLLLHPLGRHALSEGQKRVSSIVGLSAFAALTCGTLMLLSQSDSLTMLALAFLTLTLPVSALNGSLSKTKRRITIAFAATHATLTTLATGLYLVGNSAAGAELATIPIFIGVGFTWLSLLIRK